MRLVTGSPWWRLCIRRAIASPTVRAHVEVLDLEDHVVADLNDHAVIGGRSGSATPRCTDPRKPAHRGERRRDVGDPIRRMDDEQKAASTRARHLSPIRPGRSSARIGFSRSRRW